jgi:hypothetical protein
MEYSQKSIYGPMQTRFHYEPTCFKIWTSENLVGVSHMSTDFKHNLGNSSWREWKCPFMVLYKRGSTIDEYDWKSEFPEKY